jgi:uncharacterized protein (TIGR03089 family)
VPPDVGRLYDALVPTLADLRADALRKHPAAPLVTDCTQGRVELSHATFGNWVCKTVNFLQMEADLSPGDTVALGLPLHWMTAVWLVACWEAGTDVAVDGRDADLVVGTRGPVDVLVVADPLGMAPAPAGSTADAVFPVHMRAMPDQLVLPAPPAGGMVDGPDADELAGLAARYAESVGLHRAGRLHTTMQVDRLVGVLAAIAAPLAVEAAVVYGGDPGQERVTATAG